jgi:hypothetical protein
MPFYRINGKDVIFIHIPKTGGTSVNGILMRHGRRFLHYTEKIPGLRVSPQHFHAEILSSLLHGYSVDYLFSVVRNPIDRLRSEYRMRVKTNSASGMSFDRWWADNSRKYETNPFHLDNHLRPQVEFILDGCEIFKLEDGLNLAMDRVFMRIGLTEMPPHNHVRKGDTVDIQMSAETVESVLSFYRADFEAFSYTHPASPAG